MQMKYVTYNMLHIYAQSILEVCYDEMMKILSFGCYN